MMTRPDKVGQAEITYGPTAEVLTKATGFISSFDFTLNPYVGCSFGCSYCYAAFFSWSAERRARWGYWVKVKENAVASLQRRLESLQGRTVYMSSVTDPYQPIDQRLGLTRQLLEAMVSAQPRLVVQTRSPRVVRDVDVFQRIVEAGGKVRVNMTVTTDDDALRKAFEPGCPSTDARLRAIGKVAQAGLETCVTLSPLLIVTRPHAFAERLAELGVPRFITQPLHLRQPRVGARTREGALALLTDWLGENALAEYRVHYEMVTGALRTRLPQLGEGREGFRPPWSS